MKKFEVGKSYSMFSPCMHDCIWTYTVTGRTEKTITISDGKEVKKCRVSKEISERNNTETIYPLGRYSMCPALRA